MRLMRAQGRSGTGKGALEVARMLCESSSESPIVGTAR